MRTVPRLKVCWVVLATFSRPDRSRQGTLPSSLKVVTAFLFGCDEAFVVPKPVCVAYSRAARSGRKEEGKLNKYAVLIEGSIFDLVSGGWWMVVVLM